MKHSKCTRKSKRLNPNSTNNNVPIFINIYTILMQFYGNHCKKKEKKKQYPGT